MWGFFMINIQNISKTIVTKALFEGVSFSLSQKHKIGLVGPNGSGKTTLLKIILGEEEPDSGRVQRNSELLGYLPQEIPSIAGQTVGEFFWSTQSKSQQPYNIRKILSRVGLDYADQQTLVQNLSGGEKMKLGLAKILITSPTTLLLDEPTNNLDLPTLKWLESFVREFPGKVLVISHDRYFLDNCVNKIIEIDPFAKSIEEYGGNYSSYLRQKKLRQENKETAYRLQQLKEKKMKEWIAAKQQQLKCHPNPKVAKQLQAMKTRYAREFEEQKMDRPQDYQSFQPKYLGNKLHQKKSVISIHNLTFASLLRCQQLDILGNDRVLLIGNNGSGKTTFLKHLVSQSLSDHFLNDPLQLEIGAGVSIGYFSQEHDLLNRKTTVLQEFMRLTGKDESQSRRQLGGFLFVDRTVFQTIDQLSLGERARLHLAIIINQNNNFLVLDEPTNHLDLPSREVLEQSLKNYQGGFIVVSHDRFFIRQIGINRIVQIQQKELIEITKKVQSH